ncbi:phosphatase PAP2 family protein [Comamonas sp. NLF-1-9]|uniref:phosphatase PAP2 family protein n=1 Tax=Comamonas sp. NLF-1-9 TaxID=2853163 RepID=UPI001C478683|nr:phosphatase PAP2 family protein [Comamonas sp. NLF-1-9]QXL83221.1 phosphatase PAP2 family protein [Comamonas sp. NLF-1-9]
MLQEFNHGLFLLINAPHAPGAAMLVFARLCAAWLVLAVPLYLVVAWLRGREGVRRVLLEALAASALGFAASAAIGLLWPQPRPFMLGLGSALMAHAPTASFPSNHLTGIWSVALSLCLHAPTRRAGLALLLLGLPVAWARIYLGVHFPLDMLGALLLALASALVLRLLLPGLGALALAPANAAYRRLFGPLIRRGWASY